MAKVMIKHNQLWNHRKVKLCIGKTDFSTRWIFGYRQTLDTVYSLHWHCQIFHCCRKNWKLAKPSWKHSKDVDFISCHRPFKLCKECMQGYICKWWKNCLQHFLTCTNSLLITGTIPSDGVTGFGGNWKFLKIVLEDTDLGQTSRRGCHESHFVHSCLVRLWYYICNIRAWWVDNRNT